MWFYNTLLRMSGIDWVQWKRLAINTVVPGPIISFDKDNPTLPYHRPRVRSAINRLSNKRLLVSFGLLGNTAGLHSTFQLSSEAAEKENLRKYRGLKGELSTSCMSAGDLSALQQHVRTSNNMFATAIGEMNHAFSAIVDTGCSLSCTNNKGDFRPGTFAKLESPVSLGGIAGDLLINFKGIVDWETLDDFGNVVTLSTVALYHESLPGRLFSPQTYLQEQSKLKGQNIHLDNCFSVFADRAEWHADGKCIFTMKYDSSFLPRVTLFRKGMAHSTLSALQSVLHHTNKNLSPMSKIWLRWHVKLGHLSFSHVLKLALGGFLDHLSLGIDRTKIPDQPHCAACQFGKQVRKPDGATIQRKNPNVSGSLKSNQLKPGDRIFSDQLESRVHGRLLHTAGREPSSSQFCGSTLFCDAASGYIHVEHQVTLNASDTISSKNSFERMASNVGVSIKEYHTDNGIYASQAFTQEIVNNSQKIRFTGVGAKWQGGVAEGAIRIIVSKARTMMIHAAVHWPEVEDESLWPLAVLHAAYLYNHTPNVETGIAPIEVFASTLSDHQALRLSHTWGCPVYVLEPRLTSAGGKIPKWQPRSRRAQYMGVSPVHAENVGVVRNLKTGYLSPQYHLIFDDWFETVYSSDETIPDSWDSLCIFERFETAFEEGEPPPLSQEWFTPDEQANRRPPERAPPRELYHQLGNRRTRHVQLPAPREHPSAAPREHSSPSLLTLRHDSTSYSPHILSKEPILTRKEIPSPAPVQEVHTSFPPRRRNPERAVRDKGITDRLIPHLDSRKSYDSMTAMIMSLEPHQETPSSVSSISAFLMAANSAGFDSSTGLQEFLHPWTLQSPMALAGKARDPDIPSTREALSGPHAEHFWKAMDSEIDCLQKKGSWEIVDRSTMPPNIKAIPGTWAHRIKRLPCGTLSKFKSRWCCRGDLMDIEGPTYSPLVGWPTVRAAMLLAATHGWKSRQVDFCNAFLQSDQPADQPLFMELPQYYRPAELGDRDVVLRMKKSIYGQINSPKLFYEHLCVGMHSLGFEPTASDPCLFIHKELQIMVLNYCDDQIWMSPDNSLIEEYVAKLQALNYELILEEEGDLFAFLGINFRKDGSTIELTQPGLINKVITYLGMDDASPKDTPATTAPLGTDKDGEPFDEQWSYPAAIGMLLYISSNTRPDCQFAVHQAARFSHCPKKTHAQAVKRIVRYLLKTRTKGIEFVPNMEEGLNCYVDADFAGLHGYEDDQDPVSVKSRTGYTLTLFGCPIIWSSKMQTDITLSSTAAEYVAFSMAMREVLPMRALLKEITSRLGLTCASSTFIRSTVFEDNQGCLSLVNVPKMSTRNKYLALKYHFFRSSIGSEILAKYIPTTEQKADILTKGLASGPFETIRKLLLGW
jgi:Reverse transcriptase (RNA-dependent DNA polymerase)